MFNWKIGVGALKHPGFNGGSPPPPAAPTQTTVMNTNIPDYAQPYVENMLNAAQAQIYSPSGTGFNQYVPYSADPRNYVAGFSPLQQQAQSAAANLQMPGQYGMATGQTMGATGAMGRLAPQMGMAGANYAAQATSPYATAAYMNPYVGAALAPQLQLANQQYGIAGQKEGSAAAQAGAFGGSRNALMNALNAQNQMLAQNQLISQGYNTAFQNAQQAQQFGANLGLQGQQAQLAALQGQLGGANQLAGIGGAQLAAQQGILGTQAQQGALQQQNQQNIINQAVQNYATAQQYPFMQLGVLNSMLRGLPMQQSTTAMYQAPPNMASQLGSLGVAGLGAAQVLGAGKKSGGVIKAAGGIPMRMYSKDQLQQVQQSPIASPMAKLYGAGLMQENARMQNNPLAKEVMAQPLPTPPVAQAPVDPRMGVASIATRPDMTQMAGGGIIAFADEGVVPPAETPKSNASVYDKVISKGLDDYLSGKNTATEAIKEAQIQEAKNIQADKDRQLGLAMMEGGFKGLQNTSPYFGVGLGTLGSGVVGSYAKQEQGISEAEKEMRKEKLEAQKADEARQSDIFGKAMTLKEMEGIKQIQLTNAQAQQEANRLERQRQLRDRVTTNLQTKIDSLYGKWAKDNVQLMNDPDNSKRDALYEAAAKKIYSQTPADELEIIGKKDWNVQAPKAVTYPMVTQNPVAGTIYQTARGPAKWDGKQFIPVQ